MSTEILLFRKVFSTGKECVDENSVITNQAFQTRLKKNGQGNFEVHIQVSGCKNQKPYGAMVALPFCFKPFKASDEKHGDMTTLVSEARKKFIECVQEGIEQATDLDIVYPNDDSTPIFAFGVDSLEDIGSRLMSSALRK